MKLMHSLQLCMIILITQIMFIYVWIFQRVCLKKKKDYVVEDR